MLVSVLGQLGFQRVHVMALSLAASNASNALTPSSLSKHDIVTPPSSLEPLHRFPIGVSGTSNGFNSLKCAIDFFDTTSKINRFPIN